MDRKCKKCGNPIPEGKAFCECVKEWHREVYRRMVERRARRQKKVVP